MGCASSMRRITAAEPSSDNNIQEQILNYKTKINKQISLPKSNNNMIVSNTVKKQSIENNENSKISNDNKQTSPFINNISSCNKLSTSKELKNNAEIKGKNSFNNSNKHIGLCEDNSNKKEDMMYKNKINSNGNKFKNVIDSVDSINSNKIIIHQKNDTNNQHSLNNFNLEQENMDNYENNKDQISDISNNLISNKKLKNQKKDKDIKTFSFQKSQKSEQINFNSSSIIENSSGGQTKSILYNNNNNKQSQSDMIKNLHNNNNNSISHSHNSQNISETNKAISSSSSNLKKKEIGLNKKNGLNENKQQIQEQFQKINDKFLSVKGNKDKCSIMNLSSTGDNYSSSNSSLYKNLLIGYVLSGFRNVNENQSLITTQNFLIYLKCSAIEVADFIYQKNKKKKLDKRKNKQNYNIQVNSKDLIRDADNDVVNITSTSNNKSSDSNNNSNNAIENQSQSVLFKSVLKLANYKTPFDPIYLNGNNKYNISKTLDDIEVFSISKSSFLSKFMIKKTINSIDERYILYTAERNIQENNINNVNNINNTNNMNSASNESEFNSLNDTFIKSTCLVKNYFKYKHYYNDICFLQRNYHKNILRPDEIYIVDEDIFFIYNIQENALSVKINCEEWVFSLSRQMFIFLEYCHKYADVCCLNLKKHMIIFTDEITKTVFFASHDFSDMSYINCFVEKEKEEYLRRDYDEITKIIYEWTYRPWDNK